MNKKNKHSGYTLLFAVLVSSLVLGVAAFVTGIAKKQYILSAAARDSMYSFYNADSAIECAVSGSGWNGATSSPATIGCGSFTVTGNLFQKIDFVPSEFSDTFITPFYSIDSYNNNKGIPISFGQSGCALLKIWVGYDSSGNLRKIFEARGYNIDCVSGGPSSSARNVERAIRVRQ
ncbi:MAG: hypothetical protein A2830_00170 [Candidatus Taylorbacteria bacterium RIFCSPHIGHO2_01_FULL_44_110]|uniref:Type 4 fimbrial biogenesis protein PilX N-terminal domain-containing protein n=1 Tax=Candidatus Taylorbacteria bacterium RIFCSPHIGHO2_12_FULL_45_16 TaxID=1802315 RepID=A0A1G2MXZ7_9BACT|nr:MAG: hypothetical protein A2830_00170 [Candidatus Taylorbacteria bacterium RIFCSPHIGHO2_01_FULL_44_110]OHA28806.1 MAG: hypothetical protein A3F51_02395 [Candidatus Taylorbacteria bacterium RIFCSPHIGHO2_12_FULL_45_16]OHA32865.1 MAG: hypothetical protein A3A23_03195 [Candidatus Taylorbacteria bacterium RIFCSPLOWO2_01_FULL_45_59]OHA38639.1 MAG: hypothetical protein A3I98_01230 [Candidatus Taylorbacteria bacterium RIFCSPLOWO2_02_FULL_45_10b]OHA43914.1 MAG: hypothetical protein A3G04_02005 [Candi